MENDLNHSKQENLTKIILEISKKTSSFFKTLESAEEFTFWIKNQYQQTLAKLSGSILNTSIHLDELWVDKNYRKVAFSAQFRQALEKLAKEKGCTSSSARARDYETRYFYEKMGYKLSYENDEDKDDFIYFSLDKKFKV